jgi:branched-subunit amino acid aminotransferase/4-amino-4-deoxychorismate lyase
MHKVASLNGEFVGAEEAKLDAVSSAAFYGRGIFTTVAIYKGEPFLWDKHLRRLQRDAKRVGLSSVEIGLVGDWLVDLINQNEVDNGRARVTIFDIESSGAWETGRVKEPKVLIVTDDLRGASVDLRLSISPFPINSQSPLAGVKSCNYLENLIALEEAKKRGFDEAIRLNERGEVASACMANLFWETGGQLFTPSLETGCLAGTTREFVLEKLKCEEIRVTVDELSTADALFITSAGLGIRLVASLDDRLLKPAGNDILRLLPSIDTKTRMSAK